MNTKGTKKVKRKLLHGDGSIYFVEKRNRFAGQITLLIDGEKVRKTVYGKTDKIVKDKLKELQIQALAGNLHKKDKPKVPTIYQYAEKMMDEQLALNEIRQSTYDRKMETLKMLSAISDKQLDEVIEDDIIAFFATKLSYSQSSLDKMYQLLGAVYKKATHRKIIAITDKKLPTRIQVIKVDEKGNPLAGVQLQILDSPGNIIIPTWTTDGKPYEITGKLEVGKTYKLHEVKALKEYNLSKDVSFTVKDTTEVQTVRMINRKKTGQVVIQKLDGDGKALVGAQWKIYDSSDNAVGFYRISERLYTYTSSGSYFTLSSNTPSLTAMNLPLGEYYLIEETAPNGKMTYGRKIPFTIAPDSTETLNRTITVKDNNIIIPNTGSNGKALCYAAGLFSFAAALAAFTYYKKNYQSRTR